MKKIGLILMLLLINISVFAKETVRIAVLYSQKEKEAPNYSDLIEKEFTDLLGGNYNVIFSKENQITVEKNEEEVIAKYSELVKNKKVDVIIGGDNYVSNLIIDEKNIGKLSIMPFAQYLLKGDTSGVKNLTYTTHDIGVKKIVDLIRSVDKDFTEVALITPFGSSEKHPEQKKYVESELLKNGVTSIKWITYDDDTEKFKTDIIDQRVAIIAGYTDRIEYIKMMNILNEEKIVTYSNSYEPEISQQAYLSFDVGENLQKRVRKSAISLLEILEGASAQSQKVNLVGGEPRPVINEEVAEKVEKWPDWKSSVIAKIIGNESIGEEITLYSSIRKGLDDNLELSVSQSHLDIQEHQVNLINSSRFPQINAKGGYKTVDQGQADARNDVKKENLYVGVGLRQVLFNDELNTAVSVQKSMFSAEEAKYKQKELDTILKISTAYFNVLKLEAAEKIEYSNLELTKKNLELARVREKVGYSRKSDVYRWESKLATDISNLSLAKGRLSNAKQQLMIILNDDLNKKFKVTEIKNTEEFLGIAELELSKKNVMDEVSTTLIRRGIENSYEIKALDRYVEANEKKLNKVNRSFFVPEVALFANYNYYMDRMGSGDLYADPTNSDPRKEAWTVGIEVSIPLLEGGGRMAERGVATEQVNSLMLQREEAELKIEQRITASLTDLAAAKVSLESSVEAMVAAEKTLELVTDSYSRGEVSITELLDSQNITIQAKQMESASKYAYYTKLMETERAVGAYHLLNPEVYADLLGEKNLKIQ
ncbi:MAG: TolC family protein [Psychrilyobacter sp.]|nr:TolC family protein [Psychrilyobacter sp.]